VLLLLVVLGSFSQSWSQDSEAMSEDSLLLSFVYMKRGDVYSGDIIEQQDYAVVLNDQFMGRLVLEREDISRIEDVFRNTPVIVNLGENLQYTGRLIAIDDQHYTLLSDHSGQFKLPRDKIIEVEILEGSGDVSNNPNATRYFFAPSAIPLVKGKGYYQNAYLLSNSANFGITNNFSFGGGVIIPLLFYTTPKIGFKVRKNLYVGAGVIAATTVIPDALISGGIPYGVVTVGNMENNLTVGGGYAFIWNEGDYNNSGRPIITLNGMKRVSNRIQFVSENWFIPYVQEEWVDNSYIDEFGNWVYQEGTTIETRETAMAFSLGTRIMLNKRSSLDIAPLLLTGSDSGNIIIPYLDFVYQFK
jgi:small nuclear ribonucleoprotein (snRNP)-like protein